MTGTGIVVLLGGRDDVSEVASARSLEGDPVQWNIAERRFLKPVRKVMCTNSHIIQPRKPDTRSRLKLTTALKREMVAMLPRSR